MTVTGSPPPRASRVWTDRREREKTIIMESRDGTVWCLVFAPEANTRQSLTTSRLLQRHPCSPAASIPAAGTASTLYGVPPPPDQPTTTMYYYRITPPSQPLVCRWAVDLTEAMAEDPLAPCPALPVCGAQGAGARRPDRIRHLQAMAILGMPPNATKGNVGIIPMAMHLLHTTALSSCCRLLPL